nr:amidohydrolase [Planctomycetota bacterium]
GLPWASQHPGCMHACGHDGHTASLLAAAAHLKAREAELPGPVSLIFQPAEEGGHGALRMIEAGALDGIAEIYGYHNWPPFPFGSAVCAAGPVFGANGEWTATITGRGGHASQPHQTIDPIVTGANFVVLAQQIVSRQVAPQESAVVSVTCFHGGTADNIIPDAVELTGTVRAATTAQRDDLAKRVAATLAAACTASGAQGVFDYRPCYPATVNHAGPAARAAAAASAVLGADHLITTGLPLMAAEDFGYYLTKIPGCYLLLGAGRPGETLEPCHSPRFDYNDALIPVVVQLWARLAGLGELGGPEVRKSGSPEVS